MTTATPQTFDPDGRAIPFAEDGEGPVALVLLPARGMDLTSLDTLTAVLVEEGLRILRVGVRASADPRSLTMHDLARDVVDLMDHVGLRSAWIGGYAFGGAVARTVAHDHHDRADGVLLLGVHGPDPVAQDAARALEVAFSRDAKPEILDAVRVLAGASADPQFALNVLSPGRDFDAMALQDGALANTPPDDWGPLAEGLPVLVIQGSDDAVNPPRNGAQLQASAPDRTTIVPVEGGGYLFVLTHPGQIAFQIEDYLAWD